MNWFDRIRVYYTRGLWSLAMVRAALEKGKLTQAEFDTITAL